jgi:hypothetical protein
MQACCALLSSMGQVLLIVRPSVESERLPSGQSDASTSTARGRHVDQIALRVGCTEAIRRRNGSGGRKAGMRC